MKIGAILSAQDGAALKTGWRGGPTLLGGTAMNSSCLKRPLRAATAAACTAGVALPSAAADWSDTSLSWRYGTKFRESFVNSGPNNSDPNNISKNIVASTHPAG